MTRSFCIGRVLGIDIEIDYTWFIVFLLVAVALSTDWSARYLPHLSFAARWLIGIVTALLFFASVLLHELAHSVVARQSGLGISGITLFLFGGVSKMSDEPRSPGVELRVALAGPLTSLALAALFLGLSFLLKLAPAGAAFSRVFGWLGLMNGMLAVFNMLPGFPLDGGRVLRAGIWGATRNLMDATRIAAAFGQGLGFLMIVGGVAMALTGGISGLWLAVIGWFLLQAAQSSYQQLLLRQALAGVPVSSVMTREVQWVPADLPLDQVVHDHVMVYNHPAFPVMEGTRLLGLLSLGDIRHVPRERWPYVQAREVVPALTPEQSILPQADVWEALLKMTGGNAGRLLVTRGGAVEGILSRTDIMRLMRRRMELGV